MAELAPGPVQEHVVVVSAAEAAGWQRHWEEGCYQGWAGPLSHKAEGG